MLTTSLRILHATGFRKRYLAFPAWRGLVRALSQRHLIPLDLVIGAPVQTTFRLDVAAGVTCRYKLEPGDLLGSFLFWRGLSEFEPDTIELFLKYAQSSPRIVDVGAHTGIYTLLACSANPSCEAFCFEPHPVTFQRLNGNIAANGISQRCSSIQAAISSAIGHRSLQVFEDTTTCALQNADSGGIEVPVVTLDSTVPHDGKTKLIKIDVEGHEDQVLQGSSKIIENSKPVIFFECNPGGPAQAVEGFLRHRGYALFSLLNGKPRELQRLAPEDMPHKHHNFLALPR